MLTISGHVKVFGTVAIVSQQAWIFNDTVRENILFGLPYIESKYNEVISCCSLQRDLELLANGDKTEIGERGTNLRYGVNYLRSIYNFLEYFKQIRNPLFLGEMGLSQYLFRVVTHHLSTMIFV